MLDASWAQPRDVASLDDCYFYHSMDIPGHGTVRGDWDLRGREAAYLGDTDLKGKRVLEIGTASGFLCFAMEAMGAEMFAYDLSDQHDWDIVPYAGINFDEYIAKRRGLTRKLNNGFWLAHKAFRSNAKVMYGTVYGMPEGIGRFDVATFGSILLHLRDPFLALQRVAAHIDDTVIVTDLYPRFKGPLLSLVERVTATRLSRFLPNASRRDPYDTWWILTPALISEYLRILGFENTRTTFHHQLYRGRKAKLFTVVGRRRKPPARSAMPA
jgi:hypothetical protein